MLSADVARAGLHRYALCWYGYMDPYFIWSNMGALLTCGVILSKLMAP